MLKACCSALYRITRWIYEKAYVPNFSAKKKQYNIFPDEDISLHWLFLLGELMEVVQNGGKSFKTHFISVNVQSLIWRTDAVYYRCKIKGINEERPLNANK